jgi:hypothetical protein
MPYKRMWTDEELTVAVANSLNVMQAARKLGLSCSTRTLRARIKHLGLTTSHFRKTRSQHKRTFTDDQLRKAVGESFSFFDVAVRVGFKSVSRIVKSRISELGLDISYDSLG